MTAPLIASLFGLGTRYSVTQQDYRWWFQAPTGTEFRSLGVNCENRGDTAPAADPLIPAFRAQDQFVSDHAWVNSTVKQLERWGFNTIGSWSDLALLANSHCILTHTPVLHLGAAGIPWRDMWAPAVIAETKAIAVREIARSGKSRRPIGPIGPGGPPPPTEPGGDHSPAERRYRPIPYVVAPRPGARARDGGHSAGRTLACLELIFPLPFRCLGRGPR